jgi:hypothetical protein
MNNTQLQRVTRRQAGMLKLAGFDWETRGSYAGSDEELYVTVNPENHNRGEFFVSAPTVALALKWMRDVKGLHFQVTDGYEDGKSSFWYDVYNNGDWKEGLYYNTYESAENALLDKLLKLIEIGF